MINCIGKLAEKVVAGVVPGWGLSYKYQFRLEKGRLATEAAFRTVTRT